VCPVSNVALGVYSDLTSVPLPSCSSRAHRALGADDPLLFGSRLAGSTPRCARRTSSPTRRSPSWPDVAPASRAPSDVLDAGLKDIDAWLAADPS
jgi:adenosine deaminase